jgi:hypothetical protein
LGTVLTRKLAVDASKLQQIFPKYTGQMLNFV